MIEIGYPHKTASNLLKKYDDDEIRLLVAITRKIYNQMINNQEEIYQLKLALKVSEETVKQLQVQDYD